MPDFSAHDAHVAQDLARAVEASLPGLDALAAEAPVLQDARVARREAVAELGAVAASADRAPESLVDRAAHALGRLTGGASEPAEASGRASLEALSDGEDALQARFEAALADDRLSGPVRDAVLRAYDRVKPGHDAVRQALLAERGEA